MGQKQNKELEITQQVSFLKKIPFFHDFDDHELRQFLGVSKWLKVPKDTLIIKENTTERAFYILVKGEVGVFKAVAGKGKSVPLTKLSTGDCFGEMALVTEIKRTADVMATRDSFILRVEPDIINMSNVFLQLKFYKRFCEIMVTRLDIANKRMAGQEAIAAQPVEPPPRQERPPEPRKKKPVAAPPSAPKPKKPREDAAAGAAYSLPPMPLKDDRIPAFKLQKKLDIDQVMIVNPAVADEVRALLGQAGEGENTRRFADLITLDPALSCRVLQTANSPYFRRASAVATVPHAMIIVGIQHIQKVVKEAVAESEKRQAFSGITDIARSFWRHAVVVGRIADLLKEVVRINTATDIYLAGLLHDLGMLALDQFTPNFYPQLQNKETEFAKDLVKAEKDFIGVDHGQAGAWIAEGLGLPPAYSDVMRFHHTPDKSHSNVLPVALVNLANIFAAERGVSLGGNISHSQPAIESFSWVLIQEQHKPFLDVNISDFVLEFNAELDKTWGSITDGIPA